MSSVAIRMLTEVVLLGLLMNLQSLAVAHSGFKTEDLIDMDIEELMEVEVTVVSKKAEPMAEAPSVVSVVDRDEFVAYGDRDLRQLLQRQPSVYTRDSSIYSDNLAGFRGDVSTHAETHTLLLLNGRPIRESAQGHNVSIYTTFPLAALESVELVRGPGSVLYGSNAFTGVVNLKSRPIPERADFSVSTLGGSYGTYETTVSGGGRMGDLGATADIRVSSTDGYRYQMTDAMGVYDSARDYQKSFSGVTHMEYGGLTFDLFGSDLDAFALGVMAYWSNPERDYRNKRLFANVGYHFDLNERTAVELNATYNLQENSLGGPAPMRVANNTSDFLAEATLFANPVRDVNVVMGYLWENRANYDSESNEFQSIPSYSYTPQSAYAQADYMIGDAVKLVAGTQWNKSGQGFSNWTSRYGVILTPFDRWGVKLLRGEAFRAPLAMETDLYDPTVLIGNKDLRPETITTYDAQLFYSYEKVYAAVTYFHSIVDDVIIYDTSGWPLSYKNGGRQDFDGVEFETKYFLTRDLCLLGSFMDQDNDADAGISQPVTPNDMAKLGLAYTWSEGSAALSYIYFGAPHASASPTVVNPQPEAVNLLSLNVRLDTSKWLGRPKGAAVLTLRAENVLNDRVSVPTFGDSGPNSYPYGAGISLYAGLTVQF
jgi:outer membrane receptor for ferrienterochelin and colicins